MPRGWLKHKNRRVGNRACHGGSSRCSIKKSSEKKKTNHHSTTTKRNIPQNRLSIDDYYMWQDDDFYASSDYEDYDSDASSRQKKISTDICPICCENRPTFIPLMKNCTHDPACQNCLREIFVKQAQKNVTNYPLQCYHPSCRKPVHDDLLIRHKLFRSDEELRKHYRLKTFAQINAHIERKQVVYCPECEQPRAVTNQEKVNCRNCNIQFLVAYDDITTELTTIAAMESFKSDKAGGNDGLANCPRCKSLISKGSGCSHMKCFCGHDFNWNDVRKVTSNVIGDKATRKLVTVKSIMN